MSFYQTLQQATACERERLFNAPSSGPAAAATSAVTPTSPSLAQAYYHVRHTVPLLIATGGGWGRSTNGCVAPSGSTSTGSTAIRGGSERHPCLRR